MSSSNRNPPTLNLRLHPKQALALETKATEVLFGGAAGGGKSYLMRIAAIIWCAMIAGLQVYLFRRQSTDLTKNHMEGRKGLRALMAPWVSDGFASVIESEVRFWNGSRIYLCHCHEEADRFNYQGAEMDVLLIDELTHFTEVIYRFLRGRLRSVGMPSLPPQYRGMFPRILCGSNPGNVGHEWVKATFINGADAFSIRQATAEEGGMLRQFVPSRLVDNPSMYVDDPGYEARLSGLGSKALVKALRDGDWSAVEGAFFDAWSSDRHVIAPFPLPEHWLRFASFDWGYAAPFSVGWWAVSSEELHRDGLVIPRGALIRYAEWYGARSANVGVRLQAEDVARGMLAREGQDRMAYRVADPSIFAEAANGSGPSIAERMGRVGVGFRRGDNTRVGRKGHMGGWDQMRARLEGKRVHNDRGEIIQDGPPMLMCFSTCTDSIRTIPVLQHDALQPEDLDTESEDHAADEWRYACMSRPWVREKPSVSRPKVIIIGGQSTLTLNELWQYEDNRKGGRI